MSKEIDWSKAPEGATHYEPPYESGVCGAFVKTVSEGSGWRWWNGSVWQCHLGMTKERRATLIERTSKSWTGTGLPPVGTVCEFYSEEDEEWLEGKIIAHGVDEGRKWAIMQCDDAVWMGEDHEFRVKRTSEQIAAEERERAIKEIASMIGRGTFSEDAARIYDAGYRKTEAGK